ncbi:MAG: FAD-dependent oxidoreductase [Chloroflexi bacterium]|nr:MAG: FAD-dependent oxidoreductase [Chloroflexota bacterium]
MKIAVIGAGVAGLAAAYDLARAGHSVTVFEGGSEVGGLAAGFRCPHWDWSLEKYYHHIFSSDRHILELAAELGVDVVFQRPDTVAYHNGGFYPLDSVTGVLRFPAFKGLAALRFGLVVAYLRMLSDGVALERHTAHAWLQRWMGRAAYGAVLEPLLLSKFGEQHYRDVNLSWIWARLKARTPRLGTFAGGFQALLEVLAQRTVALGVQLQLNTAVTEITPAGGGVALSTASGVQQFEQCLVTVSPRQLAKLAPALPAAYRDTLLGLQSMGAVVLVLALRRRLTHHYWFNLPKAAGFPFLALVEHTNFVDAAHYGGDHLIYCGDYLDASHAHFQLSKSELLARFLPEFVRFNPEFTPDWIRETWLFRTPYAQPVPLVNHSQHLPALRTPLPGLWFASMSQVYPWDRGTNFAVELGRRVAREMQRPAG